MYYTNGSATTPIASTSTLPAQTPLQNVPTDDYGMQGGNLDTTDENAKVASSDVSSSYTVFTNNSSMIYPEQYSDSVVNQNGDMRSLGNVAKAGVSEIEKSVKFNVDRILEDRKYYNEGKALMAQICDNVSALDRNRFSLRLLPSSYVQDRSNPLNGIGVYDSSTGIFTTVPDFIEKNMIA